MISSRDAFDVAGHGALDPAQHPTHKPRLALADALRYVPRFLPRLGRKRAPASRRSAIPQLEALLTRLAAAPAAVVLLHPLLAELQTGRLEPGAGLIRDAVEARGLRLVELGRFYSGPDQQELYRDGIHPSARGQERLGSAIVNVVTELRGTPEAR